MLSAIRTREVIITRSDRRSVVAMFERPDRQDGENALLAPWVGLEGLSVRDYAAGRQQLREEREEEEERGWYKSAEGRRIWRSGSEVGCGLQPAWCGTHHRHTPMGKVLVPPRRLT